ncbi:MAG: F0F1 ATP synthase subunit alpha [Planctomycetota bacterium]
MKFKADEIASVIREEIQRYRQQLEVGNVGQVLEVGDGIAQIYGLSGAMAGEMLQFESGSVGQVFNLEESSIGAVVYGESTNIKAGEMVRSTGKLLSVPVGHAMLGRVVDPLGNPLDGHGPIGADSQVPVERPAPGIADRQPVNEPFQTGLKAVDAMTPIGRGQRQLIIGDRKTGKTAIAIDAIINQKRSDVVCVYVAIGQKDSTVAAVAETLRSHEAMGHTVIVSASSSQAAPLQYIAPYSGCSIAEHFVRQGKHTLVVYDDLSKQAAAYRQISLLLRRPPGREAYPGDVFYLHSRLLERAAKLADRWVIAPADTPDDKVLDVADEDVYVGPLGLGRAKDALTSRDEKDQLKVHRQPNSGGSMTALPICETQEGEVSAYIPTNLISITDGQLYLEPSLFFEGIRPAINVGISVSRVGYKAAIPAMKAVAASLRLDLAAYRELESFAQLGMELDPDTQARLDRGKRMVQLLIQRQYRPMSALEQAVQIFAGTDGHLDDLQLGEVDEFLAGICDYIRTEHADFWEDYAGDQALPKARQKRLGFLIDEYKQSVWRERKRPGRRVEDEKPDGAEEE